MKPETKLRFTISHCNICLYFFIFYNVISVFQNHKLNRCKVHFVLVYTALLPKRKLMLSGQILLTLIALFRSQPYQYCIAESKLLNFYIIYQCGFAGVQCTIEKIRNFDKKYYKENLFLKINFRFELNFQLQSIFQPFCDTIRPS